VLAICANRLHGGLKLCCLHGDAVCEPRPEGPADEGLGEVCGNDDLALEEDAVCASRRDDAGKEGLRARAGLMDGLRVNATRGCEECRTMCLVEAGGVPADGSPLCETSSTSAWHFARAWGTGSAKVLKS